MGVGYPKPFILVDGCFKAHYLYMEALKIPSTHFMKWLFDWKISLNNYQLGDVFF